MKSTIRTAPTGLSIAMAIIVLSSAMAVRGQQPATPVSTDATATPATTPDQQTTKKPAAEQTTPQEQAQPLAQPQTQPPGKQAVPAPKTVEHKWTPTAATASALPGTTTEKTTSRKSSGTPATTGSAFSPPKKTSVKATMSTGAEGSAITQPKMTSGTTPMSTGVEGSAITQPKMTSVKTKMSTGVEGSAITPSKTVSQDEQKWKPGSTSNALPGVAKPAETGAPANGAVTRTAIDHPVASEAAKTWTPGDATESALPADTPAAPSNFSTTVPDATGEAIDPSKGATVDAPHWEPGTDTTKALPTVDAKQTDLITPGSKSEDLPSTKSAIDQPKSGGTHAWQPDANTDTAITNVNAKQPESLIPTGPQAYIHSAVEAPRTTSHIYQYKGGIAPGVKKVVLVPPIDTRNFGNAMQQMTIEGHLVIDVPDGFRRTVGPGLLYYVPIKPPIIKNPLRSYDAAIYVGLAFVDQNATDRDSVTFSSADSYIHSDISGFKSFYKRALVKESAPFPLPLSKSRHVSYTFQSHDVDDAYEEVIYIDEGDRVFALTLSAGNSRAFWSMIPAFHKFAQSYQGNIKDGTRTPAQ